MTLSPDEVVVRYRPMVEKMVWKYIKNSRHLRSCREDLIQDGMMGLLTALKGFEPERGLRFITFAHYWVWSAVGDGAMRYLGKTTGRRQKGEHTPEVWRDERAPVTAEGVELMPEDLPSAFPRPDHLVEMKDLAMKMAHVAYTGQRHSQRGTLAHTARNAEIYLERIDADFAIGAERRANDAPALNALLKKYGVSRQRMQQAEKLVEAEVRAWGARILKEAA